MGKGHQGYEGKSFVGQKQVHNKSNNVCQVCRKTGRLEDKKHSVVKDSYELGCVVFQVKSLFNFWACLLIL